MLWNRQYTKTMHYLHDCSYMCTLKAKRSLKGWLLFRPVSSSRPWSVRDLDLYLGFLLELLQFFCLYTCGVRVYMQAKSQGRGRELGLTKLQTLYIGLHCFWPMVKRDFLINFVFASLIKGTSRHPCSWSCLLLSWSCVCERWHFTCCRW